MASLFGEGSSPVTPSRSICLLPASVPQPTLLCDQYHRVWGSSSSEDKTPWSVLTGDLQAAGRLGQLPLAAGGVAWWSVPGKQEAQGRSPVPPNKNEWRERDGGGKGKGKRIHFRLIITTPSEATQVSIICFYSCLCLQRVH